jgi:hypothetical protein
MEIFAKGQQTDEFGHTRGDAGNPVCAPTGDACGTVAEGGQQIVCCTGTCKCTAPTCMCTA